MRKERHDVPFFFVQILFLFESDGKVSQGTLDDESGELLLPTVGVEKRDEEQAHQQSEASEEDPPGQGECACDQQEHGEVDTTEPDEHSTEHGDPPRVRALPLHCRLLGAFLAVLRIFPSHLPSATPFLRVGMSCSSARLIRRHVGRSSPTGPQSPGSGMFHHTECRMG